MSPFFLTSRAYNPRHVSPLPDFPSLAPARIPLHGDTCCLYSTSSPPLHSSPHCHSLPPDSPRRSSSSPVHLPLTSLKFILCTATGIDLYEDTPAHRPLIFLPCAYSLPQRNSSFSICRSALLLIIIFLGWPLLAWRPSEEALSAHTLFGQ